MNFSSLSLWTTLLATLCFCPLINAHAQAAPTRQSYNFVVSTQTIGASYGFTKEDRLVETAREILKMGSNTLKFDLPRDKVGDASPASLTDVAQNNPAVKTVLALPFAHVLMWAYPVKSAEEEVASPQNLDANYRELYDLTRYLLMNFRGSGKTFYLGNWEGDWHLLHTNPDYVPTSDEVKNMTAWVNIRQKAVDDAKRDTPHEGVNVFHYLEVNRVQDAIAGKTRLANAVLPQTNVDFVSYSSYDSLSDIEKQLPAALDFLQSRLALKAGISGKRVWIGEYGFPSNGNSPVQQDEKSRRVMSAALKWGCPFVLYWEFYNNEVNDGKQVGFWLVNDKNEKQPIYFTHQKFLAWAREFVTNFQENKGRLPTRDEFSAQAAIWLADSPPIAAK